MTEDQIEFLLVNRADQLEKAERKVRKLQSEISSLRVDAKRRDKAGDAREAFCAGWHAKRRSQKEWHVTTQLPNWELALLENALEIYQLDKARTQEPKGE